MALISGAGKPANGFGVILPDTVTESMARPKSILCWGISMVC
jgi:hypothetical protein